jgi:catechol 2,3-dioxygenase-like lactoylglutathione lyase family enzyme
MARARSDPGRASVGGSDQVRLIGIHHVQLAMPTGEEPVATRFYADTLGLEQVPKPPQLSPRGGVWFRSGSLEVHLGVEEESFRPAVKAHPALLVQGLEKLRGRVEEAGYKVSDTVQLEGYERIYVRDPFGNRLELIEKRAG